jgi:hypothetical protein
MQHGVSSAPILLDHVDPLFEQVRDVELSAIAGVAQCETE